MHLCKCLNCFLKTHNKKLNQYCLYFILFFTNFFLIVWVTGRVVGQVGLTRKKHELGHGSTRFCLKPKKIGFGLGIFRVKSENFDLFCHVYKFITKFDNCSLGFNKHKTSIFNKNISCTYDIQMKPTWSFPKKSRNSWIKICQFLIEILRLTKSLTLIIFMCIHVSTLTIWYFDSLMYL